MVRPFLVADIGGTTSRFALSDGVRLRHDSIRRIANVRASGIAVLLQEYLKDVEVTPAVVCLAAAGPVSGETIRLTNRNWQISRAEIARATGCTDVVLLNDLQAMGYALAVSGIAGSAIEQPRLVLALGTGNNAAVAHPLPDGKVWVPPAEHGYHSLPFTTPEDASLLAALIQDFGSSAIEAALSGPGLRRLHRLRTGESRPADDIAAPAPGCEATLAAALRLLGAYLGSLALTHLPYGGLYLAGAVGRALYQHLSDPGFQHHYGARGAYSDLMRQFPLRLITDEAAPLHGAALCLAQSR
ncbi:glucokinase [Marimonas arenosa]|uniref:Glucokinase n=2 Tax=Marimonas arenosa TaxID=1795305 RepID=A0AAE3W9I0_9RHOB|nr:glucokinase [Marimonas arenosa]